MAKRVLLLQKAFRVTVCLCDCLIHGGSLKINHHKKTSQDEVTKTSNLNFAAIKRQIA